MISWTNVAEISGPSLLRFDLCRWHRGDQGALGRSRTSGDKDQLEWVLGGRLEGVDGRIMVSQRCPCRNPWSL